MRPTRPRATVTDTSSAAVAVAVMTATMLVATLETPLNAVASADVPVNPTLADSPWPTYHANTSCQASTRLRGPEAADAAALDVQVRTFGFDAPSCWTVLSEGYPDGSRVAWGASTSHIFKMLIDGKTFQLVDAKKISNTNWDIHWNLIALAGNRIIVPDPKMRRFHCFVDADPNDPRSPIVREQVWNLPPETPGQAYYISVTYDGWIIYDTDENYWGAVRADLTGDVKTFYIEARPREVLAHNASPIAEDGGIFVLSTDRLIRLNWKNEEFSIDWEVDYDFRGGAPKRGFWYELLGPILGVEGSGSGTTPTLLGTGKPGEDQLVAVIDGATPNNAVVFWRNEIPTDWEGPPGYDRRVAGVLPLPYSTPAGRGYTAENSPPAWGHAFAVAQYNGFFPSRNPLRGVQKVEWNQETRELELAWSTNAINMNGVMTYSEGSNLLYSSGRRNGVYHFYGLDWETGELNLDVRMGYGPRFLDQGNGVTINDDRSAIFGTAEGIVRIRPENP